MGCCVNMNSTFEFLYATRYGDRIYFPTRNGAWLFDYDLSTSRYTPYCLNAMREAMFDPFGGVFIANGKAILFPRYADFFLEYDLGDGRESKVYLSEIDSSLQLIDPRNIKFTISIELRNKVHFIGNNYPMLISYNIDSDVYEYDYDFNMAIPTDTIDSYNVYYNFQKQGDKIHLLFLKEQIVMAYDVIMHTAEHLDFSMINIPFNLMDVDDDSIWMVNSDNPTLYRYERKSQKIKYYDYKVDVKERSVFMFSFFRKVYYVETKVDSHGEFVDIIEFDVDHEVFIRWPQKIYIHMVNVIRGISTDFFYISGHDSKAHDAVVIQVDPSLREIKIIPVSLMKDIASFVFMKNIELGISDYESSGENLGVWLDAALNSEIFMQKIKKENYGSKIYNYFMSL